MVSLEMDIQLCVIASTCIFLVVLRMERGQMRFLFTISNTINGAQIMKLLPRLELILKIMLSRRLGATIQLLSTIIQCMYSVEGISKR